MEVTAKKGGWKKTWKVKTWVEVHEAPAGPPALAEPPAPTESVEVPGSVEAPAHTTEEGPPTPGKVER